MKRWIILASLLMVGGIASVFHISAHASHVGPAGPISIARYQGDAEAAVSFTFDDGLQCHADKAVPLLNEFGFRGTFFVIAGKMRERISDPPINDPRFHFGEAALSWEEVERIHAQGHEIGNHSLTHNFMNRMAAAELELETGHSAELIAAHIGEPPLSFAYPYNEFNASAHDAVLRHHIAVREQWTDYGGKGFTPAIADRYVLSAIKEHLWLVPMIHGIDTGFMPYDSQSFRAHLAFLKNHAAEVWVDTYADVFRYIKERDTARIVPVQANTDETAFEVECPLDAKRFNVPLTVVVPLPAGDEDEDVQVTRGDLTIPFLREPDRLLIDVTPGMEPIVVAWQ